MDLRPLNRIRPLSTDSVYTIPEEEVKVIGRSMAVQSDTHTGLGELTGTVHAFDTGQLCNRILKFIGYNPFNFGCINSMISGDYDECPGGGLSFSDSTSTNPAEAAAMMVIQINLILITCDPAE